LLKSSQAAWKQYQAERGRPPLFRVMEDGFAARVAAEEAERRAAYQTEVAAAKLATVRQLVTGEVVIKPPAGATSPGRNSPGRSRSPGGYNCWPLTPAAMCTMGPCTAAQPASP
jgi:hypothetical protein